MRIPRPALRLDITRWASAVLIAGVVAAGCSAADDAAGGSRGPTPDFQDTDTWRTLRILGEFVEGFDALAGIGPAVSIFGSARIGRRNRYYGAARRLAAGSARPWIY